MPTLREKLKEHIVVIGLITGIAASIVTVLSYCNTKEPQNLKPPAYTSDSLKSHNTDFVNSKNPNHIPTTPQKRESLINSGLYINESIANSDATDVSVTIIDDNNNLLNSVSTGIADIYNKSGNHAITGLIKSSFIHKPEFQELIDGNSDIINKLNLNKHTDYLAIGKISFITKLGTLEKGTTVCTASIEMSIIDAINKHLVKNFTIPNKNGNGITESEAKANALQKLLNYYSEYASLLNN